MASMNLSLTDELKDYVNSRAGDNSLYSTPSEYIRDLVRKDMETQAVSTHLMKGLNDIESGRFSDKSILDITAED